MKTKKKAIITTALKVAKSLNKETKALDPDRLTAMALHNNQVYNSTGIADIPDVVGWNLYFGWYDDGLENLGNFLDEQHEKYPNRPLIISEYGPGSDVRIQTEDPKPWDYSEAYQLKSHVSYYKQIMERPYVAGMAAWNFADFGSSGRQDARPFVNQKGLLNFDRTTKDIYHYYESLLLKEPFVNIAGKHNKERYCDDNGSGKGFLEITVFSNQNAVELIINDSLQYQTNAINNVAVFELQLPVREHTVIAKANAARHLQIINVHLRSQLLTSLKQQALLVNVGTHCNYTNPVSKEIWIKDQEYSSGSWGYIGGNEFQKSKGKFQGTPINILGTENDPLYQTMRENIEAYRFDAEKGKYRITLLFAEPNLKAVEELIYNLSTKSNKSEQDLRSFSIKINGHTVTHELNLARDYGKGRAVKIVYDIETSKGILIEFAKIVGKPILSGIKLEML